MQQMILNFTEEKKLSLQENWGEGSYLDRLNRCLVGDLNFQDNSTDFHPAHKIHSFPAKFPPQLPRKFILALTQPGDIVLDTMVGSGTSLFEAYLLGRKAIGVDIDPLAILLSKVKERNYSVTSLHTIAGQILTNALNAISSSPEMVFSSRSKIFDIKTCDFLDYWFSKDVQVELLALLSEINKIEDHSISDFFKLVFSSVIITKTGGVSLAIDLAHTRPHRARTIFSKDGQLILGEDNDSENKKHLTKKLRSPLAEFKKKYESNIKGVLNYSPNNAFPILSYGNAQALPIETNSVDLIVTSPPYASNAIDYMRAHKFSLVWFGYPIGELTQKRKTYIGSEGTYNGCSVELPDNVEHVIARVNKKSKTKSVSLHRYYSEMSLALDEMYRVLKPGKASVVVVGNSTLAGEDAKVEECLIAIGKKSGFEIPKVGIRQLDRNRRMLPAGTNRDATSQIQQRMHEEYVIGFYKPE
ncbi:MAG: site-specific DNA-methyltransferase [Anaerolineales bacterium]|jgi:DNA modification methylase|nr:site-specific DNA-methyltransferase [Anaerolineales bacterium]